MPRLEKDPAFDMPVPLQIAELTDTRYLKLTVMHIVQVTEHQNPKMPGC